MRIRVDMTVEVDPEDWTHAEVPHSEIREQIRTWIRDEIENGVIPMRVVRRL